MLIQKNGIYREIDPEKLQEYAEKGYKAVTEKKQAGDKNAGKAKNSAGDNG